jgi:transglutaminase-like putative cysteine protease
MPFRLTSTCILTFLFPAMSLFAEDPPMKWSEIPEVDLRMPVCALDSSASAMVLGDYGEACLNSELGIKFTRHTRIKIFTPAGYEWGTRMVTIYTKDKYEDFDDLEGATYSLDATGKVKCTELEESAIFEEEVDATHRRYRFTFPALTPGCVIEYRYVINQRYWFAMPTWTFHSSIPVYWSEYRVTVPRAVAYARVMHGVEPFFVNEESEVTQYLRGETSAYLHMNLAPCTQYRWVVRNILPLKEESFVTTLDDYTSQVQLQLAEYAHPSGNGSVKVLRTWPALVEELSKADHFGKMMKPTGTTERLTARVIAGCTSPTEVMRAIYDYVRSTIVWDGRYRSFGDGDLDKVVETHTGTSGDINLLLAAMLRIGGIDAQPVLVSTRANGRAVEEYPLVEQFNTLAIRAKAGGAVFILDATNPLRSIDMLPISLLNVRGFVLAPPNGEWITITSPQRHVHRSLANIQIDTLGGISGDLESADEEYSALFLRRSLRDKKQSEVAADVFDAAKTGLTLDSISVHGKDSMDGPLNIAAKVSGTGYGQAAGDFIYINPTVVDRTSNNPFKLKERKYPVDMSYLRSELRVENLTLPDGYEVKEKPPSVSISVGGDAISFSKVGTVEGRTIQFLSRFAVRKTVFEPHMYSALKQFYDQVVAADAAQLVLEKRHPAPVQAATPVVVPKKSGKKK